MTKKEYNGWTNYETWNVALWIGNEESSSNYWTEEAQMSYDGSEADDTFSRDENAALDLSKKLEEFFENQAQDALEAAHAQCSWMADLMTAALSEVNWHEIAEHYIADCGKETEAA